MYTKKYDENGLLINPITKEKPFVNIGENREQRRFMPTEKATEWLYLKA